MSADTLMMLLMFAAFIFIVLVMLTVNWYTKKYKTKITFSQIIISFFILLTVGAYFFIKNMGSNQKGRIVQNVALKTTVTAITFDPHKPYFKDMHLADGQYLPMPEAMNATLQTGDSIYKNKGDEFYTVVNFKTKLKMQYAVATHLRVLRKPQ